MVAEAFRTQVKNALEHLHDSAALEVHPLLAELSGPQPDDRSSGAEQLRAMLMAGIEGLRPRPDLPPHAPAWRSYLALHSRYVEGMSISDIEGALRIGRRQVQRELRKALDALCALLRQGRGDGASQAVPPAPDGLRRQPQAPSPMAARPPEQPLLLSTKLARPRVPAALVRRERLLRQLDDVFSHRLTLLSASAGWGKTTLLASWLQSIERRAQSAEQAHDASALHATPYAVRFAWLSLDAQDNQATRFWLAVIAALRSCMPSVGQGALAMLRAPEPPPFSAILTMLLNDLASAAESAVLILDDYHLIDDEAIHEGVTFFLEHLPDKLHLILTTRVDPPLPLARWRVRGELLELRAADLRFTTAEASSFFSRTLGEGLEQEDVLRLEQRTEGWIAGLQLASLSMRNRADRSAFVQGFTGSHRYLLDYIQEEILERQAPDVRRFLLRTAVLRRLNASVCAALTEDPASQAKLEMLERVNLFVVPLDDERQWYRMHDLFREVLLARLQASEPGVVPLLHQRAARWYADHDEPHEAITHALAAQDFSYAATLIERAAEQLWLSGEAQSVLDWIDALPDGVLRQHGRLALDAALHLLESLYMTVRELYARAQAQVERTIARLEAVLEQASTAPGGPEAAERTPALPKAEVALLERRIRLLRALIVSRALLTHGDTERMRGFAQEAERLSEHEQLSWKMIALWISYWHTAELEREIALLIPRLQEAKQQAMQAGDLEAAIRVMRWLAIGYLRAGRLHLAEQEGLEALALVEQIGQHSAMTGYFHCSLAEVHYHSNRLAEAASYTQQVLQIARTWQQADLLNAGHTYIAWLALASGDVATADEALTQMEELVQQERLTTLASQVIAIRVQYLLAVGDVGAASAWAAQAVFSPERWDPTRSLEFLTLIRVYLAQQQYAQALEMLERFSAHLDRPGDIEITTEFLALQVVALHQAGKREQARAVALRLLALTEAEDNVRVYLDAGPPMKQVLQSLRVHARDRERSLPSASIAFVTKLLAAFAQEAGNGEQGSETPHQAASGRAQVAMVESLTEREQQVLRLLVAGASNQEIAAELVTSLATAKKHVSNLLGKLGVASRTQAIARAAEWSLLS
jgi:LuxR family maltose regulon positive regulatory protein